MIWKIYSVYTSMGQILGNIFIPPDGKTNVYAGFTGWNFGGLLDFPGNIKRGQPYPD